ncbi:MAG: GDP-mannose 4,6-dehydratase [Gemmatimonadaceae bacterium]
MTRALLTGGGGFVGQWLTRALLQRGDDVFCAGLEPAERVPEGVLTHDERRSVHWLVADTRDQSQVEEMVDAAAPDVVFHLAGVAFPPQAERDPAATYDINSLGAVRLLSALAARRLAGTADPVAIVVGSAAQYGVPSNESPITEDELQKPLTVYGASKAAQEIAALQIFRATGMRVVCTRSFNHAGPGQAGSYLLPSLVRRVLELKAAASGAPRTLALGNDVTRDFLHVADVAAAYIALAERGIPGDVYNVSSGKGVRVSELASDILRRVGVSAELSSDPALARATDIPVLVGSPAKLMHDTGWAPARTRTDIIDDLLRFANAPTD